MLTSSLLTDRMLGPTSVLPRLAQVADVRVLSASVNAGDPGCWPPDTDHLSIEPLPVVPTVSFWPAGLLHQLANAAWDAQHHPISRIDRGRYGFPAISRPRVAAIGSYLGRAGLAGVLEQAAVASGHRRPTPPLVDQDLALWKPDLTLVTNPFHSYEPGVAAAARRNGSAVIALIPSWDNLTTKGRMPFHYDGYLVWSEEQSATFHRLYPKRSKHPVLVAGTPQYDIFVESSREESRQVWCARHDVDPDRPIVLYALGSPNMFDELPVVEFLAQAARHGDLGDAQLLVRCHPIHDSKKLAEDLAEFGGDVVVQRTVSEPGAIVRERTQGSDQLTDWVNTFRHADVVVNLSSTSTLDGAIFDHPVINLNFDPAPGGQRTGLVREINSSWEHFSAVAQSEAVRLVDDPDSMVVEIRTALLHPEVGSEGRQWAVEFVAGGVDGSAGDRFADAVLSLLPANRGEPVSGDTASSLRARAGRVWQSSRKEWRATWRWGHNLGPTIRHITSPPKLSPSSHKAVSELRHKGFSTMKIGDLDGGKRLFEQLRTEVDLIEDGQRDELDSKRTALADSSELDGEKTYLHQPLGDPIALDHRSPFATLANAIAPIADSYLGMRTQVRAYAVWHNLATPHPPTDSQLWHRDREDLQILKAFLYLDDVGDGEGPFWFAPGTHHIGPVKAKAEAQRLRGVLRTTDKQMAAVVPPRDWIQATAPAGTVVLADTRGYHKGGHAVTGDRRLVMVLFTSRNSGTREWFDRTGTQPPTDPVLRFRWSRG